ncbi:MAG: hypothetical protein OXI70_06105 [Chloroflexota bacterium]|nr:hypothetical protein [Chloroflexota bacterium]
MSTRRRRARRRRVQVEEARRTRRFAPRRWITLSGVWSVLALLAVLMLIVSLIAPALGAGVGG